MVALLPFQVRHLDVVRPDRLPACVCQEDAEAPGRSGSGRDVEMHLTFDPLVVRPEGRDRG